MILYGHLQYAKALYKVASSQKVEERVFNELRSCITLFEDKSFCETLRRVSMLDSGRLDKVLETGFGKTFHPLMVNLFILLGRARKLMMLPRVYAAYRSLYFEAKNICDVRIVAARSIGKDEAEKIAGALHKVKNKKMNVEFEVDPSLVGGVQVYEGSYVTDYSLRNYLQLLKKQLLAK